MALVLRTGAAMQRIVGQTGRVVRALQVVRDAASKVSALHAQIDAAIDEQAASARAGAYFIGIAARCDRIAVDLERLHGEPEQRLITFDEAEPSRAGQVTSPAIPDMRMRRVDHQARVAVIAAARDVADMARRGAAEAAERAATLADLVQLIGRGAAASVTLDELVNDAVDELNYLDELVDTGDMIAVHAELAAHLAVDRVVRHARTRREREMVVVAKLHAERVVAITERALASGELTFGDLFDTEYVRIAGEDLPRFRTRLSDWADRNWRPLFDEAVDQKAGVHSLVASDVNGFLPTHISARSRLPTGNRKIDMRQSRNGWKFTNDWQRDIKIAAFDHVLTMHRMPGLHDDHMIVKLVFVPLYFEGCRYGDLELAFKP